MNCYLSFGCIAIACSLIVAVNASTARSQFYDPLGVQNKSKPFGPYGPTFQYTSPTKVMNVLNGGSNNQARRPVAPSRTIRIDDLNLSVNMPGDGWMKVDPEKSGSNASYMLSRHNPTMMLSLAGERAAEEKHDDNSALLAESQAKMKSRGSIVEPGEQQLSAGGIEGVAYSASVVEGEFTTYYAMWVAAHNGYNYKLAVYGDKHDKSTIDAAMRNFVRGIKSSQRTTVAQRNSQKTNIGR